MRLYTRPQTILAITSALALTGAVAAQNWVNLSNQTSTRLVAAASLIGADNLEKDFAWGDLDRDGDIDLVCVRKFPGSIQGGARNLLLMNEGGILTDRTAEYGQASDISGYAGLLDPTNDRDVEVVDINNDGWLDILTATTMSDNVNSVLGQPRAYINLGNDASGHWLGFRFEVDRIPTLFARGGAAANPRFCDMAVADYNGDGYVDIFYTDYDTPETSGTLCYDLNGDGDTLDAGECQQSPAENPANDYDNKLLLNFGAANPGVFYDATTTVLSAAQINSGFGNMAVAGDFNGDGRQDIVRINTLTSGQAVSVYTKNATGSGFALKDIATGQPYHGDKADLNGDGRLDLVIVDDGQDKYLINTGNDATGQPNFTSYTIADSLSEFGNSTQVGDLDKDGRPDAIITDVDADLGPFCPQTTGAAHSRRTHIYRNIYSGSPSGILHELTPLVIPASELDWWTDVAIFDINGDTWPDLVAGTCTGLVVYMNVPPMNITFAYPDGLPTTAAPGMAKSFRVQEAVAGGTVIANSTRLMWSVDGGAFQSAVLPSVGTNLFQATLPAFQCGQSVRYYVTATIDSGITFSDPTTAPAQTDGLSVESGNTTPYSNDMEAITSDWTVINEGGLTTGGWEVATPIGTTSGIYASAPASDASTIGTKAWVTQNGLAGGASTTADVDTGTTRLLSPVFDLSTAINANVTYSRWYFCSDAPPAGSTPAEVDTLFAEISADGGTTWLRLENVSTYPTPNAWTRVNFSLRGIVPALTSTMRFRFSISDSPDNSTTEAGIDDFSISAVVCVNPCMGDLDGNHVVNGADLGMLLAGWGAGGIGDLDGNGAINGADLGLLLAAWGACP
ncbi:MAG: FG-GAP-like repeat-containing protein [Planctomycetota bacterium]|nr:FG-GAP-like repeat-containing protein [Planctomycetota bacterium]